MFCNCLEVIPWSFASSLHLTQIILKLIKVNLKIRGRTMANGLKPPDTNLNQETQLPPGRNKHQNQIDILQYKHIEGLKITHTCICHYLDLKLSSDKTVLQMNPAQISFFSPPPPPYLERNLRKVFGNCKLKHIKELQYKMNWADVS